MRKTSKIFTGLAALTLAAGLSVAIAPAANAATNESGYLTCLGGSRHSSSVPFRLVAGAGSGSGVIAWSGVGQGNYSFPSSQPGSHRRSYSVLRPGGINNVNQAFGGADINGSVSRACV